MKKPMKSLIPCLILTIAWVMIPSGVAAQFLGSGTIWQVPAFSSQPLQVPAWEDTFKVKGISLLTTLSIGAALTTMAGGSQSLIIMITLPQGWSDMIRS